MFSAGGRAKRLTKSNSTLIHLLPLGLSRETTLWLSAYSGRSSGTETRWNQNKLHDRPSLVLGLNYDRTQGTSVYKYEKKFKHFFHKKTGSEGKKLEVCMWLNLDAKWMGKLSQSIKVAQQRKNRQKY